ncbi:hypothetical protein HJG60_009777 [Phyllostomus discolor]|uniref:Uncharacterized protein n=1 Tax=Phyllostomus discolor TaxID=89673 RepID=A0A834B8H4_9CHIR|nr:hypothetical protein HJG60_009777 [Phyllostomus discolor]
MSLPFSCLPIPGMNGVQRGWSSQGHTRGCWVLALLLREALGRRPAGDTWDEVLCAPQGASACLAPIAVCMCACTGSTHCTHPHTHMHIQYRYTYLCTLIHAHVLGTAHVHDSALHTNTQVHIHVCALPAGVHTYLHITHLHGYTHTLHACVCTYPCVQYPHKCVVVCTCYVYVHRCISACMHACACMCIIHTCTHIAAHMHRCLACPPRLQGASVFVAPSQQLFPGFGLGPASSSLLRSDGSVAPSSRL